MPIFLLRINLDFQPKDFSFSLRAKNFISIIKSFGKKDKIIFLSHRGRPSKKIKPEKFSLSPFVKPISDLLKNPVYFIDVKKEGFIKTRNQIRNSTDKNVFLLENLRFLPGEEKNNKKLAEKLASLGDVYINDDFASSHRKHASLVAITKFLPSFAGPNLVKEINVLGKILKNPKKPFVVIIGGIKISDKLQIIQKFIHRADFILTGGGVANTFLKAKNMDIGNSFFEKGMIPLAKKLLKLDSEQNRKIMLPIDFKKEKNRILDIGSKTILNYQSIIKKASSIVWAGPLGYFENPKFSKGSLQIAEAILNNPKCFVVVGGGETTTAFQAATRINAGQDADKRRKNQRKSAYKIGVNPRLFLSTGGGAMLNFLAGKKLPAIEALKKNGKIFAYKNKK